MLQLWEAPAISEFWRIIVRATRVATRPPCHEVIMSDMTRAAEYSNQNLEACRGSHQLELLPSAAD